MQFIVEKITKENCNSLKNYLHQSYKLHKNENIFKPFYECFKVSDIDDMAEKSGYYFASIKEDNIIKSFCIYSKIKHKRIKEGLEYELEYFEEDEIDLIYQFISDIKLDGIYIEYIESLEKGYGKMLVDFLKQNNSKIMLYAYDTASEYWVREDFFKVFGYTYIHPPKAIKEFYYNPEEFKDIAWIPGVKF